MPCVCRVRKYRRTLYGSTTITMNGYSKSFQYRRKYFADASQAIADCDALLLQGPRWLRSPYVRRSAEVLRREVRPRRECCLTTSIRMVKAFNSLAPSPPEASKIPPSVDPALRSMDKVCGTSRIVALLERHQYDQPPYANVIVITADSGL